VSELKWDLIVLWRAEGEAVRSFKTKKEAEDYRDDLDAQYGNRIVKMEVTPK
jgi:hypothetical protein